MSFPNILLTHLQVLKNFHIKNKGGGGEGAASEEKRTNTKQLQTNKYKRNVSTVKKADQAGCKQSCKHLISHREHLRMHN